MRIRIYTISELRDWVENETPNGLTPNLISNARALAIVNNPYAEDAYPSIAVAFDEDNRPIGYTAVTVDKWNGKTIFFGTTGYTDPQLRGKGIGTQLYSAMKESCNNMWFVSDASSGTIAINKKLGLDILYYQRYYLKYSHSSSLSSMLRAWQVSRTNSRVLQNLCVNTSLEIVRYIDNATYAFIAQHEKDTLFHRSREMLNWILQYPFKASAPADVVAYSDYAFTAALPQYNLYAFRIIKEKRLIGFALFRFNKGDLTLLYLYKDDAYTNDVYATLVKHILNQRITRFLTFDKGLIDFYDQLGAKSMNTKSRIQQVSLSVPAVAKIDSSLIIQGGDGDMFC